ncbi:MAG TPA: molybdate ABC transporter substrate-binding protein [Lacipirellulaceae bacterium]|nr:molybdate ABC transporter substrate-binding protein [Lacipirellulaceae bacterium]
MVNSKAKLGWVGDWEVGVRVWIERHGEAVLGAGRADLLAALEREHSITKAAKTAGMSYRRAWNLIQEINAAAGEPLVKAAVGGQAGGGARLTPFGRAAIEIYNSVRRAVTENAAGALRSALRGAGDSSPCLHLAAAISLQEAVGQILSEFAVRTPLVRVRAIFGASNELADQMLAGAAGDVFISADEPQIERLESAGVTMTNTRKPIAKNSLSIIGAAGAKQIAKPADLLKSRFKRIVLAEQECPLGRLSKTYLMKIGVYEKLQPRLLHVDNSRAVQAAIASGAASAGIAFTSDAIGDGRWKLLLRIPPSRAATTYTAIAIKREFPHADLQRLLAFLGSTTAKRCYRAAGLSVVSTA